MADVSCESSSSVILPTTACTSNNAHMMCEDGDSAMMIQADDEGTATGATSSTRRVSATTQGALDALVELAATEPASSLSMPQQFTITPHQTSSDEESMPPPPPRSPKTMLAAHDLLAGATSRSRSNSNADDVPTQPTFTFLQHSAAAPSQQQPTFTFLHDSTPFDNLGRTPSSPLGGRLRSASNPEGMEKWDLYSRRNDRQHFVLPSSILEEELASTRRVLGEVVDDNGEYATTKNGGGAAAGFQQHWVAGAVRRSKRTIASRLGTSPDDVTDMGEDESPPPSASSKSTKKKSSAAQSNNSNNTKSSSKKKSSSNAQQRSKSPPKLISKLPPVDELEDDVDESTLEPEELLRRARSRLLEDLSEGGNGSENGGLNGSSGYALDIRGGVLILPHSLSKYKEVSYFCQLVLPWLIFCVLERLYNLLMHKENLTIPFICLPIYKTHHQVYNKNGRIGIYTPAERAAIIHKFNAKRARRVWNKKIRYNCRKNLADRRMRVKGRFVKRSVSEAATPADSSPPPEAEEEGKTDDCEELKMMHNDDASAGIKARKGKVRPTSPPTSGSPLPPVKEDEAEQLPMEDEDMPDVDDEEAGFDPSEDMPYRRQRRYTIT